MWACKAKDFSVDKDSYKPVDLSLLLRIYMVEEEDWLL